MKTQMLLMLLEYLIKRLDGDQLKEWADVGLDLLEDKIEASDPVWDDKLILPVIQELRDGFGIADDDE